MFNQNQQAISYMFQALAIMAWSVNSLLVFIVKPLALALPLRNSGLGFSAIALGIFGFLGKKETYDIAVIIDYKKLRPGVCMSPFF